MKPIQIISQDLFDKVRSRFQNLEMGDETGAVTIDPAEARFFDFDFIYEGNNLGRVSISLGDLGSLKVYYSQGITENQDDPVKHEWFKFLKEMRFFAMRRLLRFDTRDIAKTNLDKNDFQHLAATQGPKEETDMTQVSESRWNSQKSTKKTSRAIKGQTEVIVRHANPVDEEFAGSRSQRKNIKAIFIQNKDGERFKYPFIHPAGAFAMAQHVDHGGIPHDDAGKAIIKMSEQIAQLQEFQRKVHRATLHDDATGITERAVGRLQELKAQVECLGKRQHYEKWMAEFNGMGDDSAMPLDDVTMEQYKQKFTQTSFQEELSAFFPLLHSIMSEENSIDLEDFIRESDEDTEEAFDIGMGAASHGKAGPGQEFEEWADATEQGTLTDDQIAQLKQAIADLNGELQLGPDGQTAWQFFNELGIEDSDLEEKFSDAANVNPEEDALEVFKIWAQESYPELAVALGMSGTDTPAKPDAGSAPEQPVAEGHSLVINGKEVDMHSLEIDGVDPRDYPDFSDAYISHASFTDGTDLSDEEMDQLNDEHGDLVHELAYDSLHENEEQGGMPNKTMPTRESVVREVAKLVKSRFNEDNGDVGPFNGAPNIALDVKKKCAEMFGEEIGEQAESLALQFMEKLTKKWEEKHGSVQDDGLARLKELLGNVKAKVEGIGDQGQGGRDFNTNIMPAEEGIGSKILGGAALVAAMWGVNNHLANQAYEASPQLQKLTQFYQQAEANHDVAKMSELKRRIADHKARLDLGHGDVMGKGGMPKEIVPEMADILKLSGLVK
jgi:hypothetical protein